MSIERLREAVLYYGQDDGVIGKMVSDRFPEIDGNLWRAFWWHVVEKDCVGCQLWEVRDAINQMTDHEIAIWVAKYRMGIES